MGNFLTRLITLLVTRHSNRIEAPMQQNAVPNVDQIEGIHRPDLENAPPIVQATRNLVSAQGIADTLNPPLEAIEESEPMATEEHIAEVENTEDKDVSVNDARSEPRAMQTQIADIASCSHSALRKTVPVDEQFLNACTESFQNDDKAQDIFNKNSRVLHLKAQTKNLITHRINKAKNRFCGFDLAYKHIATFPRLSSEFSAPQQGSKTYAMDYERNMLDADQSEECSGNAANAITDDEPMNACEDGVENASDAVDKKLEANDDQINTDNSNYNDDYLGNETTEDSERNGVEAGQIGEQNEEMQITEDDDNDDDDDMEDFMGDSQASMDNSETDSIEESPMTSSNSSFSNSDTEEEDENDSIPATSSSEENIKSDIFEDQEAGDDGNHGVQLEESSVETLPNPILVENRHEIGESQGGEGHGQGSLAEDINNREEELKDSNEYDGIEEFGRTLRRVVANAMFFNSPQSNRLARASELIDYNAESENSTETYFLNSAMDHSQDSYQKASSNNQKDDVHMCRDNTLPTAMVTEELVERFFEPVQVFNHANTNSNMVRYNLNNRDDFNERDREDEKTVNDDGANMSSNNQEIRIAKVKSESEERNYLSTPPMSPMSGPFSSSVRPDEGSSRLPSDRPMELTERTPCPIELTSPFSTSAFLAPLPSTPSSRVNTNPTQGFPAASTSMSPSSVPEQNTNDMQNSTFSQNFTSAPMNGADYSDSLSPAAYQQLQSLATSEPLASSTTLQLPSPLPVPPSIANGLASAPQLGADDVVTQSEANYLARKFAGRGLEKPSSEGGPIDVGKKIRDSQDVAEQDDEDEDVEYVTVEDKAVEAKLSFTHVDISHLALELDSITGLNSSTKNLLDTNSKNPKKSL